MSWGGVLGIVTLVILGMTAAGFVYWKRTQEQMREQGTDAGSLCVSIPRGLCPRLSVVLPSRGVYLKPFPLTRSREHKTRLTSP